VSEAEVRPSLDIIVRDTLSVATLGLTWLLVFFVAVDPFIHSPDAVWAITIFDAVVAAAFFAAYLGFRTGRLLPRHANATGAALGILTATNVLHDLWLLRDPAQTGYLTLVVIGCGTFLLSQRWLFAVITPSIVAWAAIVAMRPGPDWTTPALILFAASIVAILIHLTRLQTYRRLEGLRIAESRRKEALEIRGDALQGAVEALGASEERYRRLVEQAPDAFLVHAEGRILYVNSAAVRLFGAKGEAELLGQDARALVRAEGLEAVRDRTRQSQAVGRAMEPIELEIHRLDGTAVAVEGLGQPITYSDTPAEQMILRDISDRKRVEAERLVGAQRLAEIARLKEIDRVKTQFVNTISHELRTPLTPIKVQLHLLKTTAQTPEKHARAMDVLDRNFTRLHSLVDELLEVARIQAGALRITKTYVDVSTTVTHALESYVDVANQAGVTFSSNVEPNLVAMGDGKRITQVLYNLLGNAFKFTPSGGRIHVAVAKRDETLVVSVRDSGPGLRPEDIRRLFEPFSQVHDTMTQTHAGTGLGLYICRGIIEGHGGRIWCESDGPGTGSLFAFALPIHAPMAPIAPTVAMPADA
jgi:PAS domain S-box-containing protein